MTSQSKIDAKFNAAITASTPILDTPTEDDLGELRITLLQICITLSLAGSDAGKVNGLVLAK